MSPQKNQKSDRALAAQITRAASQQTYLTIRLLADSERTDDAYRAYAYFRWVDDWLDEPDRPAADRLVFLERQQTLIAADGNHPRIIAELDPGPEENLALDLLEREPDKASGLHAYFNNLMAVMEFDARRCHQLISARELSSYTHWLAVAVTEAMHYFIGQNCRSPRSARRYLAVSGAHITHMLRDTLDDLATGYYNIPREVLETGKIDVGDINSPAFREWVHKRVDLAHGFFKAGHRYLARVESIRCRFAAFAYIHRFEGVLDCIERDGYYLRQKYPEQNRPGLALISRAMWLALQAPIIDRAARTPRRAQTN